MEALPPVVPVAGAIGPLAAMVWPLSLSFTFSIPFLIFDPPLLLFCKHFSQSPCWSVFCKHTLSQPVHRRKKEHLCTFLLGFGLQSGLSSTILFLQDSVAAEPMVYHKLPVQPEDRNNALTADIFASRYVRPETGLFASYCSLRAALLVAFTWVGLRDVFFLRALARQY